MASHTQRGAKKKRTGDGPSTTRAIVGARTAASTPDNFIGSSFFLICVKLMSRILERLSMKISGEPFELISVHSLIDSATLHKGKYILIAGNWYKPDEAARIRRQEAAVVPQPTGSGHAGTLGSQSENGAEVSSGSSLGIHARLDIIQE
ncbi:hypothetical protein CFOL_v3_17232 [Cephalotus follicularis]|uniref:Uncharacterized protein n=1 Tax=Cephalotus follicularis TaxID=3775 RepID=A0A1Q3C0R9_CEPFO|nr:hypothetical protein CFOL_v3_17232 [Cephalotus follicularis]